MPSARTLAMMLAELRGFGRARQRRNSRTQDAVPLLMKLIAAGRVLAVEERAQGLVFRIAGETEQLVPFNITCILPAAHDSVRLTPAEHSVAEMLCEGLSLARIAQQRGVSSNTVKTQVRQIFRKFNVDSRVALVRRWCP
jgi:DNA-binding CsgD family transcriptional regulator